MSGYQIPLQIKLNDAATFDNFEPESNEQLLQLLPSAEPFIYYWSPDSVGKTHLAQAVCQQSSNAFYLSLKDIGQWQPELFDGLESFALVSLDDVQMLVGREQWELSLFNLFNRLRDSGGQLRITATAAANNLGIVLPDLLSRLNWGVNLQVHSISDEAKVRALSRRARQRGFELNKDVAGYLLRHCPRDMHSLFSILDLLDDASLQAQRKITIPFIRQALNL